MTKPIKVGSVPGTKRPRITGEEIRTRLKDALKEQQLTQVVEGFSRARSITVGTAFGGTIEVCMRRQDSVHVFALLQPVEAIELIHSLAAAAGCHIMIKPREDFSSWRQWNKSNTSALGWPAYPENYDESGRIAANLPAPEQQPGLQPAMMARSESNEQTVATQKTVGRKRTKRAATPT